MDVHFIDVGQGDATLITTPLGKNILIDVGARPDIVHDLGSLIPLHNRTIDLLILTHPDLDHVGGMIGVIDQFAIDTMLHSGLAAGSELYNSVFEKLSTTQIITASIGQVFTLEPGLTLEILYPHEHNDSYDANDHSVVIKVKHFDNTILFTGDASKFVEHDLVNAYGEKIKADILQVGHHGSSTSTGKDFMESVSPEFAILSYGCNNRFGHPHTEVLSTLFINNVEMLSTCDEGTISFASDGKVWKRK